MHFWQFVCLEKSALLLNKPTIDVIRCIDKAFHTIEKRLGTIARYMIQN